MRPLRITHLTEYRFAEFVTLGSHRLLLRPREGHDIRVVASRLDISPDHDIKWHRDVYDNSVAVVSFRSAASYMSILSEVRLEHYQEAPLDFVVEDYAVQYPFQYRAEEQPDLAAFAQPSYPADGSAVRDWLQGLGLGQGGLQTYVLLDRLSKAIAGNLTYVVREEPGVQSPSRTLGGGSGSCRDYATLFIEACRQLGLACRFVSGYLHAPSSEAGNASTHAWAEAYLPGAGWKGFDPTGGELTGSKHIPVAVARHPESIPPVAGSFIGSAQTPTLTVDVRVSLDEG
jgi:transglutaminase-like putative cysteine protease